MARFSPRILVILLVFAFLLIPCAAPGADTYTITASAGTGGEISPSGAVTVGKGSDQTFVVEAFYGYKIENVVVDQNSLGAIPFYTFSKVNNNHVINAIFTPNYGSLQVRSNPSGASVFIDNTYYGTTQSDGPVTFSDIIPGVHSVRFVLQGYQEYRADVTIPESDTTVMDPVILDPIPATTTATTTVPTTSPTTTATTTVPTTSPTTTATTTVPTTSPTTTATTTVPTTSPTTTATTTVPTTSPTTTATTTVPTTSPTTTATTTVPTPTRTTTVPTTIPSTEPTTTVPTTVIPTTSSTTPIPTSGITQGNGGQPMSLPAIPGVFFILAIGGLATIILSRDVLSSQRLKDVPLRRRILAWTLFFIPFIALIVVLDWSLMSPGETAWGIFPELVTAVVPLMLYLVLSSVALMMGALISWPFRGMLKAHTVAGVLVIFLALLALIGGDPTRRFMTGIMLLAGVLSTLAARWQDGTYTHVQPEAAEVPSPSISRPGPDETRVSTSTGTGLFPPELADTYAGAVFVGSGGLARVFKAKNLRTGQTVALKIPIQHDENTGKAFLKEIIGWEGLSHENIVKVSAANILPVPYVEMEFINRTLAEVEKPLPMGKAARICRDIALGLQFAHDRGIIHRDIKPQNILVTPEGVPKITDWGMSKVTGVTGLPTITGFSLAYAAPEQLAPQTFGETDQRTDIYQMGCVLYELVTGAVPFPGSDMAQVSSRIISQRPDLPSSTNPSLQPLDTVIMRCLEKKPGDRYQNVRDLIMDLEEYLASRENGDKYNIFED